MTKLEYMLREGLIEITYGEKNLTKFSRRMKIYLNNQRLVVRLIDTNLGKALHNTANGEILVLSMDIVEKYGVPMDLVEGLNVDAAIEALKT